MKRNHDDTDGKAGGTSIPRNGPEALRHLPKEDIQMVNKYVKRCFTSCHQGDMQIKAMSQHSTSTPIQFSSVQWLSRVQPHESQDARPPFPSPTPIRLAQTWNADASVSNGPLPPPCRGCKMEQPLWKTVWQFPTKLLLSDPANTHHGIYPKELKTHVYTNCSRMFKDWKKKLIEKA